MSRGLGIQGTSLIRTTLRFGSRTIHQKKNALNREVSLAWRPEKFNCYKKCMPNGLSLHVPFELVLASSRRVYKPLLIIKIASNVWVGSNDSRAVRVELLYSLQLS